MDYDYESDESEGTISLEFSYTQTTNMCMEAVKQNGYELEFVEQQLPKICLAAVRQNGLALEFVEYQTEFLCFEAVKQNGLALEFVEEQTHEICMEAVRQNGLAIQYVFVQTLELCEVAYEQTKLAREYMWEEFQEVFRVVVRPRCYETPPESMNYSDFTDPITLEPLVSDTIYAWIVEGEKWYLAGSLETINEMIETNYKQSSLDSVFIPIKNALFPVNDLHWVRV